MTCRDKFVLAFDAFTLEDSSLTPAFQANAVKSTGNHGNSGHRAAAKEIRKHFEEVEVSAIVAVGDGFEEEEGCYEHADAGPRL